MILYVYYTYYLLYNCLHSRLTQNERRGSMIGSGSPLLLLSGFSVAIHESKIRRDNTITNEVGIQAMNNYSLILKQDGGITA